MITIEDIPLYTLQQEVRRRNRERDPRLISAQDMANGFTTREIATRLGLSERTIEFHFDGLKKQHDCTTRAHLIATLLRKKLIK